jgi:hypothetical protein
MYDITKKKKFSTVGDLKELLKDIPDETKIVVTGDDYCWFHIEEDGSVICLDVEELDDAYEIYDEDDEYVPSAENGDYSPSNPWDAPGMSPNDFI